MWMSLLIGTRWRSYLGGAETTTWCSTLPKPLTTALIKLNWIKWFNRDFLGSPSYNHFTQKLLVSFNHCSIESILTYCTCVWFIIEYWVWYILEYIFILWTDARGFANVELRIVPSFTVPLTCNHNREFYFILSYAILSFWLHSWSPVWSEVWAKVYALERCKKMQTILFYMCYFI